MHNQLQSVCSFISFTLRSFIYSYNQLLRFLYLGISDDDIGHRVALRLLGMDNSLCGADVSKLLLFGEGIVGEIVQETLEIFDSLENRTTSSTSCGRGFSVRNGGFQFELRYSCVCIIINVSISFKWLVSYASIDISYPIPYPQWRYY